MSKEIHLTVDLSVGDVEDYLYREPAKSRWNGLTDDEKWECFDYIWDHQDDTEYEMGFYDGDLCTLVEEWWMDNKYQEEAKNIVLKKVLI